MKRIILLLILISSISNCYASCSKDQIDINSAELEELIKIKYIGQVKAQEIISSRPFKSLDDLINVKGIGEITLEKIKAQEIVCLEETEEETIDYEEKSSENPKFSETISKIDIEKSDTPKISPPIKYSPQIIKTQNLNSNVESKENNYIIYGLVSFFILISILLILRKNRFNKNEFRN